MTTPDKQAECKEAKPSRLEQARLDDFALPATQYALSGDVSMPITHGQWSHRSRDGAGPGFVRRIRARGTGIHGILAPTVGVRVIIFDKRGQGLSDRISDAPSLEQRMDDVRAVMDAASA